MTARYHAPLGVIAATGPDAVKFLQGQLTQDVAQLDSGQWRFSGHCDAKGKLWSLLRLARLNDTYYLISGLESTAASLAQLRKFAVFSKVELTDLTGHCVTDFIPDQPLAIGQVSQQPSDEASQCFSLGLGDATLWLQTEQNPSAPDPDQRWLIHEIMQGVVQLTEATIGEYVPQMVGLDRLNGINFKKGCYIGQETVARMHYLGQNKRALRLLCGEAHEIPAAGTVIEQKLGDNWRRAGAVINAVRYDSNEVYILAVVPADLSDDVAIRIKGDEQSRFTLRPTFDNQEISNE